MSAAEADGTQSALGDGGGGPGAPTPLSVLDVSLVYPLDWCQVMTVASGRSRSVCSRH